MSNVPLRMLGLAALALLAGLGSCRRPPATAPATPSAVVAAAPAGPPVPAAYEWIAPMQGNSLVRLGGLATDGAGNTYVGGRQQGLSALASADGQRLMLGVGRDNWEMGFVAGYGPQGQLRWAQVIHGLIANTGGARVDDLALGPAGQVYALGTAPDQPSVFTSSDGRNDTIRARSGLNHQPFVACYSGTGRLRWVRPVAAYPKYLRAGANGSLYLLSFPGMMQPELSRLDSLGQGQWKVRLFGLDPRAFAYRPAPQGEGVWLLLPGQRYLRGARGFQPEPVGIISGRDTLVSVRPSEFALVRLGDAGKVLEVKKVPQPLELQQVYLENRGVDLGFDEQGRPRLLVQVLGGRNRWAQPLALFGQPFDLSAGPWRVVVADEQGTLRGQQQLPMMGYNTSLLPTGSGILASFPLGGTLAVPGPAGQTDTLRSLPNDRYVDELVWGRLDAQGRWQWALPGGGTASNYHRSMLLPLPGAPAGRYLAGSDVARPFVVGPDTLPAGTLYVARIQAGPAGVPPYPGSAAFAPAEAAAQNNLRLSFALASPDTRSSSSSTPLLRLYATSPRAQPLRLALRGPGGKVAFQTTYPLQAGSNVVDVDLGGRFRPMGYYELELWAGKQRCPAPRQRPPLARPNK